MRSNHIKNLKGITMFLLLVLHSRSSLSDQAGTTGSAAPAVSAIPAASSDSISLGDPAVSESISNPSSVLKLISEYAQDYTPADMSNPVVNTISNWIGQIQGTNNEPDPSESISAWDYTHPAIANIPSFIPFTGLDKYEEEYTFWDWLKSNGVYFALVLLFFGVIPYSVHIIPYAIAFSTFWSIFGKFYSLNEAIIGLLGAGNEHDHHHDYGWGWEEGAAGGWNPGWRQLGQQ